MKQKEEEGVDTVKRSLCSAWRHAAVGRSGLPLGAAQHLQVPSLQKGRILHTAGGHFLNLAASAPKMWELTQKKIPLCVHLASEPWIGSSVPLCWFHPLSF